MSLLDDLFALIGYVPAARYEAARRRLEDAVETHTFNRGLYERTVFDLAEARARIAALEAELEEPTADTAEEPAEAPAPTPVVGSPWRPPGWYRDTDGTVGRLLAVDRFAGTQTLRWGDAPAVLTPGPRPERRLSASEVQRLKPVPAPGDELAGDVS